MSELVAFLEARLAEDEQMATDATRWPWDYYADGKVLGVGQNRVAERVPSWNGVHIARHDPARVLREVTAKRAILAAYVDAEDAVAKYPAAFPGPPPASYWQEWGNRHAWREAVELLAAPFSDHPDFQEQWR